MYQALWRHTRKYCVKLSPLETIWGLRYDNLLGVMLALVFLVLNILRYVKVYRGICRYMTIHDGISGYMKYMRVYGGMLLPSPVSLSLHLSSPPLSPPSLLLALASPRPLSLSPSLPSSLSPVSSLLPLVSTPSSPAPPSHPFCPPACHYIGVFKVSMGEVGCRKRRYCPIYSGSHFSVNDGVAVNESSWHSLKSIDNLTTEFLWK